MLKADAMSQLEAPLEGAEEAEHAERLTLPFVSLRRSVALGVEDDVPHPSFSFSCPSLHPLSKKWTIQSRFSLPGSATGIGSSGQLLPTNSEFRSALQRVGQGAARHALETMCFAHPLLRVFGVVRCLEKRKK